MATVHMKAGDELDINGQTYQLVKELGRGKSAIKSTTSGYSQKVS